MYFANKMFAISIISATPPEQAQVGRTARACNICEYYFRKLGQIREVCEKFSREINQLYGMLQHQALGSIALKYNTKSST